jgi:hypothetical protein
MPLNLWWSGDSSERYWMEITDREVLGHDIGIDVPGRFAAAGGLRPLHRGDMAVSNRPQRAPMIRKREWGRAGDVASRSVWIHGCVRSDEIGRRGRIPGIDRGRCPAGRAVSASPLIPSPVCAGGRVRRHTFPASRRPVWSG